MGVKNIMVITPVKQVNLMVRIFIVIFGFTHYIIKPEFKQYGCPLHMQKMTQHKILPCPNIAMHQ